MDGLGMSVGSDIGFELEELLELIGTKVPRHVRLLVHNTRTESLLVCLTLEDLLLNGARLHSAHLEPQKTSRLRVCR